MVEATKIERGTTLKATDRDFESGIRAAVDYRGDVTITLQNGSEVVGYVFNGENDCLELFPIHGSQKESVLLKDIQMITFSGEDTAHGKSWEDWIQKKARESQIEA